MYAVLIEVNANDSHVEQARNEPPENAAPAARQFGAKAGYWLAPIDGRGLSVVVFETEDQARQAASMFHVREPPMDGAPEGVTVKSVSVHEVLASV
jgi:hypothetical protein